MTTSSEIPVTAGAQIPVELLYRVPHGKVLHGKDCQHLSKYRLASLEPATELDREKFVICRSCLRALGGDEPADDGDRAAPAARPAAPAVKKKRQPVVRRIPGSSDRTPMPDSARAVSPEPDPPTCPNCYMQLPATGACDTCD
ncbi:hypothetical protein GCM10027059_38670 [Myceligenerans halotolerans]